MDRYIVGLIVILIIGITIKKYYKQEEKELVKTVSVIRGTGKSHKVMGIVYMNEMADSNTHVYGKIMNLPHNETGKHAFHIHKTGNLINGCKSLGPHYNPFNKTHSGRVRKDTQGNIKINYDRHVGDLGNLVINRLGHAQINFVDPLIKLSGPTAVIGRSLVIHEGADDLGKGGTDESIRTGSAGSRIACGIIGLA
jgi:Cu-Zn family superoxide dismutase